MAVKDDAAAGAASTPAGAAGTTTVVTTPAATPTPAAATPAATTTTTTEEKPAAKGKEPGSKDDTATLESKAPEKYDLKLPDGGRIDARDLATIETVARQQGWSNEEAQQRVAAHADAIEAQSTRFLDETTADKVYGGANLEETKRLAKIALNELRPEGSARGDALRALLDKSGYGNHLEVLSLFADLGKRMAEDGGAHLTGGDASVTRDAAELIYGKSAAT